MAKETIETLVSELTHEEEWRRMRATAACLAGGPRAVHALIHVLATGDTALAIEAIGLIHNPVQLRQRVMQIGDDEASHVKSIGVCSTR